jgi:hypothetical protein
MLALAASLRVPGLDGAGGVAVAAGALATIGCWDSPAPSGCELAGVTGRASASVDVLAVSVSSSDRAGPLVRFGLFAAFFDCFGFFVIVSSTEFANICV